MENYTASSMINTPSVSNEQQYTSTATLSNGNYIVVYSSDHTSNGTYHIYGQKYDTDGDVVGSETQLSSTSSSNEMRPIVAARSDGFVIAWTTATTIYRARFNNSMVSQLSETSVDSSHGDYGTDLRRYHAHVNTFTDDGYVISYSEISGAPDTKIVYRIYNSSDTQTVGETTAIHKTTAGANTWFHWASIATDTGTYGAETFGIFSFGPDSDLFGYAAEQDGTQISSNTTNYVGTELINGSSSFPTSVGNGDHFILTQTDTSASNRILRVYTVSQNMNSITEQDSSNPIDVGSDHDRHGPPTVLDNGDVVVAFMYGTASNWDVRLQYYDYNSGGAANLKYTQNGSSTVVANESADEYLPIISNSGDSFMVSWADENDATGDWDVRHVFYNITVCLMRGTMIRTVIGDRPIEQLRVGQILVNDRSEPIPLLAIKRFTVPLSKLNHPIIVPAKTFGDVPIHDLWVSPRHKLQVRGRMKCAQTIEAHQDQVVWAPYPPDRLEYYHLLVGGGDHIIANGLVVESYHPPK